MNMLNLNNPQTDEEIEQAIRLTRQGMGWHNSRLEYFRTQLEHVQRMADAANERLAYLENLRASRQSGTNSEGNH